MSILRLNNNRPHISLLFHVRWPLLFHVRQPLLFPAGSPRFLSVAASTPTAIRQLVPKLSVAAASTPPRLPMKQTYAAASSTSNPPSKPRRLRIGDIHAAASPQKAPIHASLRERPNPTAFGGHLLQRGRLGCTDMYHLLRPLRTFRLVSSFAWQVTLPFA